MLIVDFSQLVLCSGSWQTIHIPQSSLSSSFTFPQSAPISRALSLFEDFYTAKFSGRRLTVAYPLSTVDLKLKMPESGHSYTFTSTALQAGTLLLFNNSNGKAEFTVDDIAKTLSTPVEALVPHITGIAKTKMVKLFSSSLTSSSSSESITQDTVVALNPKFFSKRPKFVLPMGTDSSKSHAALLSSSSNSGGCGSEESLDVYADRLERVEACLAHVMKAKKVLAFVVMQDEVRALLSQRFLVTPKLFKKAVESLVEKGYIARSDDDRGLFKYIS